MSLPHAASPAPFPQLHARADAALEQQAARQLSEALTSASLDRELARLQPLISDLHAQLRDVGGVAPAMRFCDSWAGT
jgi:hypothetical protein